MAWVKLLQGNCETLFFFFFLFPLGFGGWTMRGFPRAKVVILVLRKDKASAQPRCPDPAGSFRALLCTQGSSAAPCLPPPKRPPGTVTILPAGPAAGTPGEPFGPPALRRSPGAPAARERRARGARRSASPSACSAPCSPRPGQRPGRIRAGGRCSGRRRLGREAGAAGEACAWAARRGWGQGGWAAAARRGRGCRKARVGDRVVWAHPRPPPAPPATGGERRETQRGGPPGTGLGGRGGVRPESLLQCRVGALPSGWAARPAGAASSGGLGWGLGLLVCGPGPACGSPGVLASVEATSAYAESSAAHFNLCDTPCWKYCPKNVFQRRLS